MSIAARVELTTHQNTQYHKLTVQHSLASTQKLVYKSQLYLGGDTTNQAITGIFDTKSDWLLIQTTSCGDTGVNSVDCPDKVLYDTSASPTYVRGEG